ncbi:MAG: hypothetical protein SWO11_10825 [Thermodesulfobacteriota bacterium]|nr:hypothetical protein [Thermodesulfobacteriota bacterium]
MPDGLTHLFAGYVGSQHWLKGGRLTLFLIGCLLPDIIARGSRLFFIWHAHIDFLDLYIVALHIPFTCLFICMAIVQLFNSHLQREAFLLLYAGCIVHFVLDFFQRTISGFGFTVELLNGYHWLYPFSWYDFQFGLFWPKDAIFALILLLPLSILIFLRKKR